MTEPAHRFIVVRAAPDLPDGFLPDHWEGRWLDLDTTGSGAALSFGGALGVATERFERRESDGATARVFEVRR